MSSNFGDDVKTPYSYLCAVCPREALLKEICYILLLSREQGKLLGLRLNGIVLEKEENNPRSEKAT